VQEAIHAERQQPLLQASFLQFENPDIARVHTLKDESRIKIVDNERRARSAIGLDIASHNIYESPKLLLPVHPGECSLPSSKLGLQLCQSVFLHGFPSFPHRLDGGF
jgi:hypothetical protein